MARTNISVEHDVFEKFSLQAERQNKTLYAFANESLLVMAEIVAEGGNPDDLLHMWRSFSILKEMEVVPLPSAFLDELIAKEYAVDKAGLMKMFREFGASLVGILRIEAEDIDGVYDLAKHVAALLPVRQLRIKKADDSKSLEVDIVGVGRRLESALCTLEFVKAILNGYGYTASKEEVGVGTIRIWAFRKSSF
jgi:hypothetical protein